MNNIYTQLHDYLVDIERIPVLVLAILLTMIIGIITGPFRGNAYPFFFWFYDVFLGTLGDRLAKKERKRADLMFRGFLITAFGVLFAFMVGKIVLRFIIGIGDDGWLEVLFVALSLTSGTVWFVLLRLYFALEKDGSAKGAFFGIARSTRVNLNSTDDYGITRVGLGFTGVSFDKGLVAPAFWYFVGGIPLMAIYTVLSALAWRFGKGGFSKGFGEVPVALEKLMGFVPSILAGFLLAAASAVTPTAKLSKALTVLWAVRDQSPYEQGGLPVAALAWPLEVSLGGPVKDIAGSTIKNDWVGPKGASAKVDYVHLRRGIIMNVVAHLLFLLSLGAAYLYGSMLF